MVAQDDNLHIRVSDEMAELGSEWGLPYAVWGDTLEHAAGPCRKKVGEEGRGRNVAWACCSMRGWRESMEDVPLVLPFGYLGGAWRDSALFAVFDGHGGEQVARFVARQLPLVLAEMPPNDAELALAKSFLRIDELLRGPSAETELASLTLPAGVVSGDPAQQRCSADRCGSTAVCCLVRGSELVLAHAGDSRAVLARKGGGAAEEVTEDHKPDLPREVARIEAAGGFLQEEARACGRGVEYRVNGDLNLSRALGDLHWKDPAKQPEKQIITGVPDTRTIAWKVGKEDFLLMASDGIWECMTSQEVVNFVRARLPPAGTPRIRLVPVLEALMEACCANHPMQRGGLGCDNMSVVMIRFEDPEEVVACTAAAEEDEAAEPDSAPDWRLDAALSQTIQRLSSRQRLRESPEERAERIAQAKQAQEENLRREVEEHKRKEERKRRRDEREAEARKDKRRTLCCCAAAADDESEDSADAFAED